MNVITAKVITIGTNTPLTLSAILAIGAFVFVASTTSLTISDIVESLPIFSALYKTSPSKFIAPAITLSSILFLTGIDSPLINDSSTCVLPLTTIPSTANLFPGLAIKMSSFLTSSINTSFSLLLTNNNAVFGVIVTKPFIASFVFSLLISSIYLPNLIR